jgi:UDP-GlcNAc:undecaprenyl-phosphate/decaprenyl-phosphate GlcNAc-1-phosphate transferase
MSMIGQYWTILLVATAVIVTVALIHYGDRFARAWAWVDHPGGRKKHKRPTPLHGGLAIFLAILPAMACLIQVDSHYLGLVVAAIVLVMVGVVDDLRPMNAKLRMLLQWLVAILVCSLGGIRLENFGDLLAFGAIDIGGWSIVVTGLSVVGIINAINMLDGADGLAAGLVTQILLWYAMLILMQSQHNLLIFILPCVASLLAYLVFNFPWRKGRSASVFLGDSGSTLLGLIVVWFAIELSQGASAAAPPVRFLWLLAVPLYDTGHVMWRRFRQGVSVFNADRKHLHHVLLDMGNSVQGMVIRILLLAIVISATGLGLWMLGLDDVWLFAMFMAGFCVYMSVVSYWHEHASLVKSMGRVN